ncbi:MAG: DUF4143 domain-containing protein [Bacteroidales bacterium]|nr:DUF4143 domain-containing protein [Bacteroidales bacterium]
MGEYKHRIADKMLVKQLEAAGVVLVQGAKWCGKTTTAIQAAKSILLLNNPQTKAANLQLADTNISVLLEGDTPRLIDEWQLAPQLWDAARFEVDQRENHEGQFIFTGSAVPADKTKISHSGTGRFAWLTMRPMSLWESEDSTGCASLEHIFENKFQAGTSKNHSLDDITYLICRGGWPASIGKSPQVALRQAFNYIDAVENQELSDIDDIKRDSTIVHQLLRSYARHQATQAPISTIQADLSSSDNKTISDNTIIAYLDALRRLFVIEDTPAWNPNLRSKAAIRSSNTRYFVDPSIATAALRIGPKDLASDLKTLGLLFETMAIRDLRIYADAIDGDVFHYRDNNGLECDAIVHLKNGHYGLIEIKLGGETLIEEGAKTLKRLSDKIDTDKMYPPSFLMVLVGVGTYAYQRKDGILVVPIGSLKD